MTTAISRWSAAFPIVARNSRGDVPYELDGKPEKVKRGFLDVTVQVNRRLSAPPGRRRI